MHYNIYSAAGSFHHPPGAFPLYLPKSREMEAARAAFFFSFRAAACVHFSFDIHREREPSPCTMPRRIKLLLLLAPQDQSRRAAYAECTTQQLFLMR